MLPLVPGLGRNINGARIWVEPRTDQLPARRVRQARARDLLRRLPRRTPRADRGLDVEGRPAAPARAAATSLPIVVAWGFAVVVMVGAEGPRLVAAVLHAVRRDDVGRHRARQLPRDRLRHVRRRRVRLVAEFGHVQTRVDIWLDPWARPVRQGLPDRPVAVRHRPTAASTGTRPRPRQPRHGPRGRERLHLRRHRRGARV